MTDNGNIAQYIPTTNNVEPDYGLILNMLIDRAERLKWKEDKNQYSAKIGKYKIVMSNEPIFYVDNPIFYLKNNHNKTILTITTLNEMFGSLVFKLFSKVKILLEHGEYKEETYLDDFIKELSIL